MEKKDLMSLFTILIVSLFLVADLFFHPGRSITYDGHVHITTIAQFYNGLKDGEFPVGWANGFANYGLPIPVVAHQTTSYLGAFFQFFTQNAVLSYNLVTFTGVFASSLFFYFFLRKHFSVDQSLIATILFHFAPYRITNIYVRGALPELFGSVFIPIVLIGLYEAIKEKKKRGVICIILGTAMLALTHPMLLVLSSILLIPYSLFLLWPLQKKIHSFILVGISGCLGLLLAGYYLLPLALEIKYFSYGTTSDHFRPEGGFLKIPDFFVDGWSFFGVGHAGPRSNTLTIGSIETLIILVFVVFFIWSWFQKKKVEYSLLPWLVSAVVAIFLMTKLSIPLYKNIVFLNNVQYPWRNLSSLMFIPPFFLAWLLTRTNKRWLGIMIIVVIGLVRFPQLYGKNFMTYDLRNYDFVTANLHTNNMNTLWMGDSRDYPVKTKQLELIDGNGSIENISLKNSVRTFTTRAEEPLRMVDYTFYFPGWKVFVDGVETEIQFQDPQYRGMITYQVPAGEHAVKVAFTQTKIRLLGVSITLFTIVSTAVFIWALHSKKVALFFFKRH